MPVVGVGGEPSTESLSAPINQYGPPPAANDPALVDVVEPAAYRRQQMPMTRRIGYAFLVVGVLVAVIGLLIPVSGAPAGTTTEVSCGTAGRAAFGTVEDGDETIMTGADTALTKSAFCEGEAGDVLRPTLAAAAVLVVLGAAAVCTSVALGRRQREGDLVHDSDKPVTRAR